jgi:uncharacterized protein YcfL
MRRELLVALALLVGCGHRASPPAVSEHAVAAAVGARAPDAQLAQASGDKLALAEVLQRHAQTVVVFYRGFW